MKKAFVLCVFLVLPGVLHAAVGDLKPVSVSPRQALMAKPLFGSRGSFTKPTEGDGTVNKHAMVATLKSGKLVIKVAIDTRSPDTKVPDVIRFDFTGEGKFDDKLVVPLKRLNQDQASFGPATLDVQVDGRTIPVTVRGGYFKSGTYRQMNVSFGTAVEGTCAFGEKTYAVRVIDGNNNLRLGDVTTQIKHNRKLMGINAGDTLVVDTGDGSFAKPIKSFYGQPVLVDGKWYDVTISADVSKVSARQMEIEEAGTIKITHKEWSATFIGEKYILMLKGDTAPIAVPPDRYVVTDYQEMVGSEPGKSPARLMSGFGGNYPGKGKVVEVKADQMTEIPIGSPLTASITAKQSGRTVRLSLVLTDASGANVDDLTGPKGGRPPAPKVEIFDTEGKSVYKCTLEYG